MDCTKQNTLQHYVTPMAVRAQTTSVVATHHHDSMPLFSRHDSHDLELQQTNGSFSNVAFIASHVQPYRPALALGWVGKPCGLYDQRSVDHASTKHLEMPEALALQNAQSGQTQCCAVSSKEHRGMTLGTAHRTACSGWACLAPRANPIPKHCLPQCLAVHELGLGLIVAGGGAGGQSFHFGRSRGLGESGDYTEGQEET